MWGGLLGCRLTVLVLLEKARYPNYLASRQAPRELTFAEHPRILFRLGQGLTDKPLDSNNYCQGWVSIAHVIALDEAERIKKRGNLSIFAKSELVRKDSVHFSKIKFSVTPRFVCWCR